MTQDGCSGCKHVREHVASLFPFKVLESVVGKPLRIGGVAMAAGMPRNFNVYTPDKLAVFAEKLVKLYITDTKSHFVEDYIKLEAILFAG